MKGVVFFILSAFIGIVCSMAIILFLGPIHIFATCGLAAGLVGSILYYGLLAKSNMKLLISVVVGIIVFILYYLLYSSVNVNAEFGLIPFIVFVAPYVLASGFYFLAKTLEKSNKDEWLFQKANLKN